MRIGALAATAGCNPKTIRFYEDRGLIAVPPRASNGYRDYPPETVERLAFVRDAQAAGLSLAEIREVIAIRDAGEAPCVHVGQLIAEHLTKVQARIAELRATRARLVELSHRAADANPADCTGICAIISAEPRPSRSGGGSEQSAETDHGLGDDPVVDPRAAPFGVDESGFA